MSGGIKRESPRLVGGSEGRRLSSFGVAPRRAFFDELSVREAVWSSVVHSGHPLLQTPHLPNDHPQC